ncbi:MAG: polymer-forming cytoskeletal protein [Glaciimonas sp.]|nr:polymer-forming cytoskeletal protein [Glaciimonas sp.]
MFNRKAKHTIDSLIGSSTSIQGEMHFKDGLRIDGHIEGNIVAEEGTITILVISENAKVEGQIRVAHLVVNGDILGNVFSSELLELQPKARIIGDVNYKTLEMHSGALLSGKLTQNQPVPPELTLRLRETYSVPQIPPSSTDPELPKVLEVSVRSAQSYPNVYNMALYVLAGAKNECYR